MAPSKSPSSGWVSRPLRQAIPRWGVQTRAALETDRFAARSNLRTPPAKEQLWSQGPIRPTVSKWLLCFRSVHS
jgi:hypothetical protein